MPQYQDKVIFANQLRAVAIIAVMITHLCGIFWAARGTVATYIFAPVIEGPYSPILSWLSPPTVNYGPLGVSIFFLISGFVIPFSLSKFTPREFLISRSLRIYPTYLAGSAVTLLSVWLSSQYWNKEFSINLKDLLFNLSLTHSNILVKTIDLVNWSLAIEIKFYLIAALMHASIKKSRPLPIISLAVATLFFTVFYPTEKSIVNFTTFRLSIESIKVELMVICFMFTGTLFHFHFIKKISTLQLISYSSILLMIVAACWSRNEWAPGIPNTPLNYSYGFFIFLLAYIFKNSFRAIAPLDFIANISYPLYIIHSLVSYSIMRIAVDQGLPFYAALMIAIATVILISYILHMTFEKKSIMAGKIIVSALRNRNTKKQDRQFD